MSRVYHSPSKGASYRWPRESVELWRIKAVLRHALRVLEFGRKGIRHEWTQDAKTYGLDVAGDLGGGLREELDRYIVRALDRALVPSKVDRREYAGVRP